MKILFVYQELSTFVKKDLEILKSSHIVKEVHFKNVSSILLLWDGIKWCDISFSWFGKLHAFFCVIFSKLFDKKSVVIAGGDEATKSIVAGKRYGLFAHPVKKWFVFFIFRYADLVLSVSEFTLHELVTYAKTNSGNRRLIYHGFDHTIFKKLPSMEKIKLLATIGDVCWENFYRKGYKIIVETAFFLPYFQFAIIGPWLDDSILELKKIAPSNVIFTEALYDNALIKYLSRVSVYLQVSELESFGCALAEAMLCECIPVVSRMGAIPEVVGNCGFYIDKIEPGNIAEKIKEALQVSPGMGRKARERITELFPMEKRKRELLEVIAELSRVNPE